MCSYWNSEHCYRALLVVGCGQSVAVRLHGYEARSSVVVASVEMDLIRSRAKVRLVMEANSERWKREKP